MSEVKAFTLDHVNKVHGKLTNNFDKPKKFHYTL